MWLSTPKEGEDRVYHRAGEGTCLLCAKDGEPEHRLEPDRGIKGTRVRSLGYKEMRKISTLGCYKYYLGGES